ncbi:septation protein IspZ [uncultured Tateyamaria sp.]|uniref:inner membrane-spanning protein YciB n=1 Tax=uncultured Tateyamaria sp. TaxID=455651 RepID=UPI00261C4423|nr:septation protein IspZ [uncultured Tateyamaria sp.]
MTTEPLNSKVKTILEIGPVAAFVVIYLILRNDVFVIGGTEYTGFVVVVAAFMPVFLAATAALWVLSGKVARIQVATAAMLLVFGGLSIWLNDPRVFQMKPTAIYLLLAAVLGVGLMFGKCWLKFIMDDMIPLKPKGWMILTKRLVTLFVLSAAANELVWRTHSERFWVLFETLVMPVVVFAFFVLQIGLIIDHAKLGPSKKKR